MILLDENNIVVHDEEKEPPESIGRALALNNMQCAYANPETLYRFSVTGTLFIATLTHPKFSTVTLDKWDLQKFREDRRVATDAAVVRDVGCGVSKVYLDTASFSVPTEVLLR